MKHYTLKLKTTSTVDYNLYDGTTLVSDTDLGTLFGSAGEAYFTFDFNSLTPLNTTALNILDSNSTAVIANTSLEGIAENKNFKGTWSASATAFDTFVALTGVAMDEAQISTLAGMIKSAGPTVVQTTGTSTADVMSQNATTSMIFADPDTKYFIRLGADAQTGLGTGGLAIGRYTKATGNCAIAIGAASTSNDRPTANGNFSIAIGTSSIASERGAIALGIGSSATHQGEMNIGAGSTSNGYNSTVYRLISGVHDGQSAHDAATYGQLISYSAINGAGAPTTATEGKYVGQLYYDTTNEAMYFLKAIDTTTDPDTYTWEALGGGSSVNVVQSTGTSTTNVMSQNAVTSMVFADPSTKHRVRIGLSAATGADGTVAIGESSQASESGAVAVGSSPSDGAKATGANAVAFGRGRASAVSAVAYPGGEIGTKGVFQIGLNRTGWETYGYNDTQYRLLTGLYDGASAHDAATYGQMNTRLGGLTLLTISQTDYDNLQAKDPNTLYVITGA